MKRIDPLLRIAQAEMDILKKYMEARRIDVEYNENGYPRTWKLVQNKRGYRKAEPFDDIAFQRMQSLFNESAAARITPSDANIKNLMNCIFEPPLLKHEWDTKASGPRACKHALERTIYIEDESGEFVYDYEAGYYPGEESNE